MGIGQSQRIGKRLARHHSAVPESLEVRWLFANPSVAGVTPTANATGVALNAPITVSVNLPNGRLNSATVIGANVTLFPTGTSGNGDLVPSVVNTTGGGDAIILTPMQNLKPNTQYTFSINSHVQDVNGDSFVQFSENFTTGSTIPPVNSTIAFSKTTLSTALNVPVTDMQFGPDGLLYASTETGLILRYAVNSDGTLGVPQVINSLQTFEGAQRLISGFAFDPKSTAADPIIWVSNTYYALSTSTNAPNLTSKLTVMSGPDLATVQDAIIGLPRSVSDHVNDQPVFQPGTENLFFCQAGQNAYGDVDGTWKRPETMLSGAILKVDTTLLNPSVGPLTVLTPDVGGNYNPFATGAPLTIYADGIRNAFTLFFDDQGQLWAPVNGSASGGNTPSFTAGASGQVNGTRIDTGQPYAGPNVPALTNVLQTEEDTLVKVQAGAYYGHPNPERGEYVLQDGNPTSGGVPGLAFAAYPSGTNPDPNYHLPNYVFGLHNSPDGMIEYQGSAFGGALNGKFLVAEYSAGDDIVVLSRDANDNIIGGLASGTSSPGPDRSISGFSGFTNPVTLIENPATGYIYVSELGGSKITLLKPSNVAPTIAASASVLAFSSAIPGSSGAGPSHTTNLTITNTGADTLLFDSGAFTIQASGSTNQFSIVNVSSEPTSLATGASFTLQLQYTASAATTQSAQLEIASNDPATPTLKVMLNGVGTNGQFGYAEPTLVQVLRANNIPTIVGAGPNDSDSTNPIYPENPDPSSQEVAMQRLVVAGPGPVTITPLATFTSAGNPAEIIGYYPSGDITTKDQLFTVATSDAQTFYPTALGATSFNPGVSPFSLYMTSPGTTVPNNGSKTHYSEDVFNTADPTHPRKFRFFPMENPDGTKVPNTYIVAAEDFNSPTFNSFVNFVGIISNVAPAGNATGQPNIGVSNSTGLPSSTQLVFNRIQIPNTTAPDAVHNQNTIQITNSGTSNLTISSLVLSDPTNWEIVNPPAANMSIAPGVSIPLTIQFIATTDPPHTNNQTNDTATTNGLSVQAAGGVWSGTLTINSNDPTTPAKVINLKGYWQDQTEHENEPGLQTIINSMFGYGTLIDAAQSPNYFNTTSNPSTPVLYGEEFSQSGANQGLWVAADATSPVSIVQIASYHNEYTEATPTQPSVATQALTGYYLQGGGTTFLYRVAVNNAQTLFPQILPASGTGTAKTTFSPGASTFGFNIDGEKSQDALNTTDINTYGRSGHSQRFYPLRDSTGQIVPNMWLMGMDYQNGKFDNFDYQDNLYLITNMAPAGRLPTPNSASATLGNGGALVQWAPVTGATGYNVYSSTNGGAFTKLTSTPITTASFIDATATAGATVAYKITAVNSSNLESEPATASLTLSTPSNGVNPVLPSMPSITQADGSSGTQVVLSWTVSTNATSYILQREGPGESSFSQIGGTLTTTSYTDTNVIASDTYQYRVEGVNANGNSSFSAVATATVTPQITAPAAPGPLTADVSSGTQIVLTWGSSPTATDYRVERLGPSDSTFMEIATGVTNTTYTDATALPGISYQYRVRAENSAGLSPYDTPITAMLTPVVQPQTLDVTVGKGAAKRVVFTDPDGTLTTISMSGLGTAVVHFTSTTISQQTVKSVVTVNGTNVTIAGISTAATSKSSTLKVTTKGGNGSVTIGGIVADGTLGAINAPTAMLDGALSIAGAIGRLVLGSASGVQLSIGQTLGTLQIGVATGVGLSSVGAVKNINAMLWDSTANITAPAISSLRVKESAVIGIDAGVVQRIKVGGSLQNSTITLTAGGTTDLSSLNAGSISNVMVNATGSIGAVSTASLTNSRIFAGIGTLASGQNLPATTGAFASAAFIGSIILKKIVGASSFVNSDVAASLIKRLSLQTIQYSNSSTPFGVAAIAIDSFSAISPANGKPFTFNKLTTAAEVTADFAAKEIAPLDFELGIV